MKYILQYGCKEWQEDATFNSLEDAEMFCYTENMIMGLYPATYAYIENENGEIVETVL